MTLKTAITGSGIMAAPIALLLTQYNPEIEVTVFERDRKGREATFSNHGRLHGSGSSLLFDTPEISRLKLTGAATMALLEGAYDTSERALYAFERDAEAARFRTNGAIAGVPIEDVVPPLEVAALFGPMIGDYASMFEHATNFARLRDRMLAVAGANGARLVSGKAVTRVAKAGARTRLFAGGEALGDFDIVINRAGRFAATIDVDGREPLARQQQAKWPVFILPLDRLAMPNRVLTVVDADKWMPSMIPHLPEGVITMDCKPPMMETSDDPFALKPEGPLPFNTHDRQQRLMLDKLNSVFPALGSIDRGDIGVFYGVHGRTFASATNPHHTPSDILRLMAHDDLPGYLEPVGGLATTALFDALATVEHLAAQLGLAAHTASERLGWLSSVALARDVAAQPRDAARWELMQRAA